MTYLKYVSYIFFLVFIFTSCKKTESTPQTSACIGCSHKPPITYDTVFIEDSSWLITSARSYESDLQNELRKINFPSRTILCVQIAGDDGTQRINPGESIVFKGGHLSLGNDALSFEADYGQLPFRTLDVLVFVY